MIQNLPTNSAVAEVFFLASQLVDIKFLILLRLVGMTDSFVFRNSGGQSQSSSFLIVRDERDSESTNKKCCNRGGFSLASQHVDSRFLILLRLVGMTDSFIFKKNRGQSQRSSF